MNFLELSKTIGDHLKTSLPKQWDGKECITQMRDRGCRQWKQMEWIGFYFQFRCEQILSNVIQIPGTKYGRVQFDGFLEIPWDFKAHAINTSSHQIVVNDRIAIEKGILEFGAVGIILALGTVEYNDENRTFQKWHSQLKGGKSQYEIDRIARGAWSRLRKTRFDLQQISFIKISNAALNRCGSFQKDFRNADGHPRKEKVLIDLEQVADDTLYFVEFES